MFMCLVVVGDWSQGSKGIKKPRKKRNNNERFDSTVDNIHNPSLFVIYQNTRNNRLPCNIQMYVDLATSSATCN
jgi:hypothetical protein